MIKKKILNIKIIFKTYLKILNIGYKYFKFPNRLLFYKASKNDFQKLFSKTVFLELFPIIKHVLNFFYKKIYIKKNSKEGLY